MEQKARSVPGRSGCGPFLPPSAFPCADLRYGFEQGAYPNKVAWARRRVASAPWIAAGILLSLAAAAVEALGLSPGGPVSHDDVYHSIEIGALVLLYRGGLLLGDLRPA